MINGYSELNSDIIQTIELIKEFENSSKEQLLGIEQINNAVAILDQKHSKMLVLRLKQKILQYLQIVFQNLLLKM